MIDSHVHIGGDEAGFLMNEEMVLTSMEKYNIDISIVSNGDSVEYGENFVKVPEEMQIPQEETLARVIKFCRENPGKIYGAFWCKPNHEVVTEELDKMIEDIETDGNGAISNGNIKIKSISVHAHHH